MKRLVPLLVVLVTLGGGTAGIGCASSTTDNATPTATTPATTGAVPLTPLAASTDVPNTKLTVVAGLSPKQAADLIGRTVTQSHPVLFPNAVPDTWSAEASDLDANGFHLRFTSPDSARSILFALVAANPREPEASTVQTEPNFHGDPRSVYQVQDKDDAASFRWLLWNETGVWGEEPVYGAVPYYLAATGLTDAEFWQIANSLHPIQR
jgi:hypothetical protein